MFFQRASRFIEALFQQSTRLIIMKKFGRSSVTSLSLKSNYFSIENKKEKKSNVSIFNTDRTNIESVYNYERRTSCVNIKRDIKKIMP